MKIKNLLIALILSITMLFTFISNMYAAQNEDAKVNLKVNNSSTIKKGDEIIVDVEISITGFDGIVEFLADVVYDKDVLEYKDVIVQDGWSLNSSDGKVYIEKADMKEAQGKICSLKFIAKKQSKDTTITLENIDASGIEKSVYWADETVNTPALTINMETGEANQTSNSGTYSQLGNTNTQNNSNNKEDNNQQSTNNKQDNNQNKNSKNETNKKQNDTKTQKTNNSERTFAIIGAIIIVAILIAIGVILVIRYLKPVEKKNKPDNE